MKHKKKKGHKMHVGEEDYLLANRRASREIEIERHGKPVSLRPAVHTPKTAYSRSRMKRQAENEACLLCVHSAPSTHFHGRATLGEGHGGRQFPRHGFCKRNAVPA